METPTTSLPSESQDNFPREAIDAMVLQLNTQIKMMRAMVPEYVTEAAEKFRDSLDRWSGEKKASASAVSK